MASSVRTVIIPVRDLPRARELYGRLTGVAPSSDAPYYVGFTVDGQQIGLDPNGHRHGMTGPLAYWHVDDVAASLAQLVDAGAETVQPVTDVGGGKLIASARDADGNMIGLTQD
jgi:predicted enzyme related to lactoylglutathione lyase